MAFKGGSLVSNILQKSSTLDEKLIESSTQKLSKKVSQLKVEVYENIRQNYVEFQSYAETTISLEERLREVDTEYRRLEAKVEGELKERIAQSAGKRQEIEAKLKEIQLKVEFVQRLVSIHQVLQLVRQNVEAGDFSEAAGNLQKASEDLKGLAETGCEAKVFNALQVETAALCSEADVKLVEEWNRYICWSPLPTQKEPTLSDSLKVELRVLVGSAESSDGVGGVANVIAACKTLGTWEKIKSAFGKRLLRVVLKPLILNPTLRAVRAVEAGKEAVVLKFKKAEVSDADRLPKVYENLMTVFKIVQQILPEEEEWMWEVGQVVCGEVVDQITEHHLAPAIPKTHEELQQYERISSLTAEFEGKLIDLGMVGPDFCELSEYTQNVSVHFAEQKRKDLLARARSTLMKSIHNTEIVTPPESSEPLGPFPVPPREPSPEEDAIMDLSLQGVEDELKDLGAKFPVCAVSKCVIEFVDLLDQTLRECYASETRADKVELFRTARDMVDLYCAVVPTHHKTDITTIPRAAAVHYNNSMYVTHYLIVVGLQIHSHLRPEIPYATFLDQIPIVRQLGEDAFQVELRKQRNSILGSLKAFGDFNNVSSENKRDEVYRGVRQGLFQLTQLSRVYKEVLPAHLHKDAVGSLLDVLLSHVVKEVVALEDIVSADATELHEILAIILEKGPTIMLFSDKQAKDVAAHCASWPKLQELSVVLNARLQEIVDRWAAGKGSLAQQFKPVEVRGLIKALFSNTDRRAAALSKITM